MVASRKRARRDESHPSALLSFGHLCSRNDVERMRSVLFVAPWPAIVNQFWGFLLTPGTCQSNEPKCQGSTQLPRRSVRRGNEQTLGFFIADHHLLIGVPVDRPTELVR